MVLAGAAMSHAAPLLVPLGIPQAQPGGPFLPKEQELDAPPADDDPWADEPCVSSSGTVWSSAWFHALSLPEDVPEGNDAPVIAGEARFAEGRTDGSIHVYARNVYCRAAEATPRRHRRQLPTLSVAFSPTNVDNATVGTTRETVEPVPETNALSPRSAEDTLEAQFHATDVPQIIEHPSIQHTPYTPHQHEHCARREIMLSTSVRSRTPSVASTIQSTLAAASANDVLTYYIAEGDVRCVRRLYSPDATRVNALMVDDQAPERVEPQVNAPRSLAPDAQLVACHASGRIVAWNLGTLAFSGAVLPRVSEPATSGDVQFVFEHQAAAPVLETTSVFAHTARVAHGSDTAPVLQPLRVWGVDADRSVPPLIWAYFPTWHERIFVLKTDAVRSSLVPCAVLNVPRGVFDTAGALTLCAGAQSALHLYAMGSEGTLTHATYRIDWDALCRGLPLASTQTPPASGSAQRTSRLSRRSLLSVWLAHAARPRDDAAPPSAESEDVLTPDAMETYPWASHIVSSDPSAPDGTPSASHSAAATDTALAVAHGICAVMYPDKLVLLDAHRAESRAATVPLPSAARRLRVLGPHWAIECASHLVRVRAEKRGTCIEAQILASRQWDPVPGILSVPLPDALVPVRWANDAECAENEPAKDTAVLPQSLGRIVVAQGTTELATASLDDLFARSPQFCQPVAASRPAWHAPISLLQIATNPRTGTRHLLGGSTCGDLAVWDASTLHLVAEWSVLPAPIQAMVPLAGVPALSRLYGCVLCVATDSTCALLALDDLRLVHMFPGSDMPLVHAAVRSNELLLVYGGVRARLWNMETAELVRSVSAEQIWVLVREPSLAGEMWHQFPVPTAARGASLISGGATGMLSGSGCAQEAANTVLLADVRRAVESASKVLRAALGAASLGAVLEVRDRMLDDTAVPDAPAPPAVSEHDASKLLTTLRPLLRMFVPTGMDPLFDAVKDGSATQAVPGSAGTLGFVSLAVDARPETRFCLAPETTAQHLVAAVALLLLLDAVEGRACLEMVRALLTPSFMRRTVGTLWVSPSLSTLATYILDENETLRTASALLFHAYAAEASAEYVAQLTTAWGVYLPRDGVPATAATPQAVFLLGLLATEQLAFFSPSILKHVATLVVRYLVHPTPASLEAYIALELCYRGCHIWQHYVDAVVLVRGVFALATLPDDSVPGVRLTGLSLRGLARRATLELTAKHSALFMSTLAMDILHAPSVEQSQVTLRLVAFMIRQKPLVLYPSLPRLTEAVVKSLDPSLAMVRSSLAKSAALMINQLVQTYPMIAFHGPTQRLAVGTHDGPIIMYDVKTGTRLFVLNGHSRPVTACSFAPDGRRFLSMSLDEECVLIWRLNAGLMDMFVPRIGKHDDTSAYRSLQFHLGDAARLSPVDVLSQVSFEWRDARAASLRIGVAHVNVGVP